MAEQAVQARGVRFLGYGACALAATLWGTGFYFGRLALDEMSVEHMVLYRFLFASLGMLPAALEQFSNSRALASFLRGGFFLRKKPLGILPSGYINWRTAIGNRARFTAGEMRILLLAAAFGIPIQFLLQFHGLALTTVSHASLMVGAMPVLLAAAAALFAGERLDWMGWLALCGSTVGAALVVLGGSRATTGNETPSLQGDLLVIFSLVTALAWILLSKKLMRTHSPVVVSAYTILAGTAMLMALVLGPQWLAPLTRQRVDPLPFAHVSLTAWVALAISGLLCTATTTFLWNWGIHHVPASRAGVFLNIEPALGSLLGVELLGERLGPYAWLGGALIICAAVVLTTRGHEPEVILE